MWAVVETASTMAYFNKLEDVDRVHDLDTFGMLTHKLLGELLVIEAAYFANKHKRFTVGTDLKITQGVDCAFGECLLGFGQNIFCREYRH